MDIMMLGSKEYPFGSSHGHDPKAGGGIETHVQGLSRHLSRNHKVWLITRRLPGQRAEEGRALRVIRVPYVRGSLFRTVTFNLFSFFRARALMRKEHVDIIHCHGPIAGFFGTFLSRSTRKPMVLTPHGVSVEWPFPLDRILRWFETYSLRRARRVLFISQPAMEQMSAWTERPCRLLTNGVEMSGYQRKNKDWKGIRFLYMGRLEAVKGIKTVVEAFHELQDSGSELWIAGEGTLRGWVLSEAIKDSRIRFLGWVDDVPGLLSRCDAFVLASEEKGKPVALIEAMASGITIITSLSFITEKTGIKIGPDRQSLLDAMDGFCRDPGQFRRLGAEARREAKRMDWGNVAKEFVREYKEVLAE